MNKRNLSLIILGLVFLLSGVAVYLGISLQNEKVSPDDSSAATPINCIDSRTESGVTFCINDGRFKAVKAGKLVIYTSGDNSGNYHVFVNGARITLETVSMSPEKTMMGKTSINVQVNTEIKIRVYFSNRSTEGYGWTNPSTTNQCGELNFGKRDIGFLETKLTADGYQLIEKQCWADEDGQNASLDFNDFLIAVGIEAEPTATSTLTPTATMTTTPTATATATPTATLTPTLTLTPSATPTGTPSPTLTPTATRIVTPTITQTTNPSVTVVPTLRPPKSTNLPRTAIIDDRMDTIIAGILLMMLGIWAYGYVKSNTKS